MRNPTEVVLLESMARSLPHCYEDLGSADIAEHQFDKGVRRLNLENGGPTYALRVLIDELRGGQTNADDLDTALNVLEVRLCIPLTTVAE